TNLTGIAGTNGITVTADDVTIDLNGFTLIGAPGFASLNGIQVPGTVLNLAVRNGTIRNWGGQGVNALNAGYSQFTELYFSGNISNGVSVGGASTVWHCKASGNTGIGISANNSCLVKDCITQANGVGGISISGGTV